MITIDQLLESVDLDFEPRWVTKGRSGYVEIWSNKPEVGTTTWYHCSEDTVLRDFGKLKLSEFSDKDWQECIYEVPRKTTEKIKEIILTPATTKNTDMFIVNKINELVDAVNELKGAKNE